MRHAALTALLLLAAPAQAGDVVLSVEGGMAFMGDSNVSSVGSLDRHELATTTVKGVSAGYEWPLWGGRIRGLLGYDYTNVDGDWGVSHDGDTARQTVDIQSSSFVLGLEYDIKQLGIGPVYPFAGVGLRLVNNRPVSGTLIEFRDHEDGCLADDPDTWGFGYHALAGLAGGYKSLTVSVFYQYTGRGSVDVGGDGCPEWNGGKLNSYTAEIRDHSIRLRLSVRI